MSTEVKEKSPEAPKPRGRGTFAYNVKKDDFKPQKSVEGWIIFVTNVHEETQDEDIHDVFSEFGEILNMHLNLDRKSAFVKGYCLIEYKTYEEALAAIKAMNGKEFREKKLGVSWTFREGPIELETDYDPEKISSDKKMSSDRRRKREFTTDAYNEEKKKREKH